MKFILIINSRTLAPDIEATVICNSRKEAIDRFVLWFSPFNYTRKEIEENTTQTK